METFVLAEIIKSFWHNGEDIRNLYFYRDKSQVEIDFIEVGIAKALATFKEAQTTADPLTITLSEYTFLTQELELCEKDDRDSFNSLKQAIQNIETI